MRLNVEYEIKEIDGETSAVPKDIEESDFKGVIKLNETGEILFRMLENDVTLDDLTDRILSEYEIDEDTARDDVLNFVEKLEEAGIII